jgi:hypothetical protein
MHNNNPKDRINIVFLILGLAIVCYILLRAYYVDITDDEAWSFYNVKKFWYVETLCSGNTHWFNFAAIKMALLFGLEKAWQLRWFSVLSGIMFLYIGYIWIKGLPCFYLKLFAFSLIFLNPFLLEYLTLARGYSAGLYFVALSLCFFIKSISENEKRQWALLALVFAGFSAVANFSFFYFFVIYCVFHFCQFYFKNGFKFFKSKHFYIDVLYSIVIVCLVLRALLFIRECANDLSEFGGDNLITSVFGSYIDTLFYGNLSLHPTFKFVLACSLFVTVLGASIFGIAKFKTHCNKLYQFASAILLGMLLLTVFNKWCFHVLYPIERTGLMFYPLMSIVVVQFFDSIQLKIIFKKLILYFISVMLIINFSLNMKLISGYDHSYCMNTKPYFDYLSAMKAKKVGLPVELYFVFLKYYQITNCQFHGESINEYKVHKRWILNNKLQDFEYLLLLPPYDLSYYKSSHVKFKAIMFFSKTKAIIVKVIPN